MVLGFRVKRYDLVQAAQAMMFYVEEGFEFIFFAERKTYPITQMPVCHFMNGGYSIIIDTTLPLFVIHAQRVLTSSFEVS